MRQKIPDKRGSICDYVFISSQLRYHFYPGGERQVPLNSFVVLPKLICRMLFILMSDRLRNSGISLLLDKSIVFTMRTLLFKETASFNFSSRSRNAGVQRFVASAK